MGSITIRTMFNLEQDYEGKYYLTLQQRYVTEILEAILEENEELLENYEVTKQNDYDPFRWKIVNYDIFLRKRDSSDNEDKLPLGLKYEKEENEVK